MGDMADWINDYSWDDPNCPDQFELLHNLAEAVLLFHSSSPWTEDKVQKWAELTGHNEATTKVLCDLAREALGVLR